MKTPKNSLVIVLGFCVVLASVSAQNLTASRKRMSASMQAPKDLVQTLEANTSLASLLKAVKAADFTGALSQAGPFTVFAPTDNAFAQITAMTELMQPANKEKLASILKYHVVQGKLMASELRDGQTIATLTGEELAVSVMNGKLMVNGAEVTQSNVMAANGVVHVINRVLLPGANLGNK